jgi:hypothetical protein
VKLGTLQEKFAAALRTEDVPLDLPIREDGFSIAERLAIYRNNFLLSLVDALAANFPTVVELVDLRFFEPIARAYVLSSPPVEPSLFAYGEGFPDYLARKPSLADYPYVAEMARLELAFNRALHAPEEKAEEIDAAMNWSESRWRFAASVSLLDNVYPCLAIWEAHRIDRSRLEGLSVAPEPNRTMIYRGGNERRARILDKSQYAFLTALQRGEMLQNAVAAAQSQGNFSLEEELRFLFSRALLLPRRIEPASL